MTNYNKRLDKIFPDESKDTELQHHLRNVWHDNFSEQEFIDEMEAYITSLIKELVAEARIDELIGVRGWTEYEPDPKYSPAERFHIVPYTYLTNRIAELKGVKNK